MMPEFFCLRRDCGRIVLPSDLAASWPRYQLGQPVKTHFTTDEGEYLGCDRGIVIGVLLALEGRCRETTYWIAWMEMQTAPYLLLPHISEVLESDLEGI